MVAPGYDDSDWGGVRQIDWDLATLVAPSGPPVRRTELVAPVTISTSPAGRTIVDFGQNLVGRLRLTVHGEAGQTITCATPKCLRMASCVRGPCGPRRPPTATRWVAKGWKPGSRASPFTASATPRWRTGQVRLEVDDLRAVVCHSDLERTGWFECSDPLINRLHENVVWSMRGNFLDVPTDCPQRDERLGWTGDIQVFAPTACFLYDSAGFLILVARRSGR